MTSRPARLLALALFASLGFASPSLAGNFADAAIKVDEIVKAGKLDEAYEMMRAETANLAGTLPFAIKRAMFVSEKPIAYGSYKGAASSNLSGRLNADYLYRTGRPEMDPRRRRRDDDALHGGFRVAKSGRRIAGRSEGFWKFRAVVSREALQEIYTPLTLDVSQVPKGDYVIRYIFTDVNAEGRQRASTSVSP